MNKSKTKRTKKGAGSLPGPRRVIIATPVGADAAIKIWYTDALINSMRMSMTQGVELFPIYKEDVLIQRARNDLLAIAIESGVDDLIWIDSDVCWNPEWLFKLLSYPVDVVGGTYPKKNDVVDWPVKVVGNKIPIDPDTKLLEVDGLGTGFLRLSKKAMQALWGHENKEYHGVHGKAKWIFEVIVENGEVTGEDIVICHKLQACGFKIYLDPAMCCGHVGLKMYSGNFSQFLEGMHKQG
jgi:hypothetical protein